MGEDCGTPCNGRQVPMDSGICVCNSGCDHGESCLNTCNGRWWHRTISVLEKMQEFFV